MFIPYAMDNEDNINEIKKERNTVINSVKNDRTKLKKLLDIDSYNETIKFEKAKKEGRIDNDGKIIEKQKITVQEKREREEVRKQHQIEMLLTSHTKEAIQQRVNILVENKKNGVPNKKSCRTEEERREHNRIQQQNYRDRIKEEEPPKVLKMGTTLEEKKEYERLRKQKQRDNKNQGGLQKELKMGITPEEKREYERLRKQKQRDGQNQGESTKVLKMGSTPEEKREYDRLRKQKQRENKKIQEM